MQSSPKQFTLRLCSFIILLGSMAQVAEGLKYSQARTVETRSEMEVRQAAEGFVEFLNNLDWEKLRLCFAEDATMFFPSAGLGLRVNGRNEIIALLKSSYENVVKQKSGPPYLNIRPKEVKIQMLVDAAIVTFHRDDDNTLSRRTL